MNKYKKLLKIKNCNNNIKEYNISFNKNHFIDFKINIKTDNQLDLKILHNFFFLSSLCNKKAIIKNYKRSYKSYKLEIVNNISNIDEIVNLLKFFRFFIKGYDDISLNLDDLSYLPNNLYKNYNLNKININQNLKETKNNIIYKNW